MTTTTDTQESPAIAQAVSPAIAPDSAGRYDLVAFIRGSGEAYLTKNNWASDEVMWTEADGDNRWRLRKNNHSEEFGLTPTHILRGIDDSPGDGAAYVLTNPDGSQGSPWSPRYMKVGDVYKRTAIVTFRDLKTGAVRNQFTHITWLKFAKFHASWKSSQGLTVANVIELEAYEDVGGKIGKFVERYWYVHGLGLGGWQDNGVKLMGIAARPGNLPKTARMEIGWYNGLMLPKSLISPLDARFTRHTLKAATGAAFNVRSAPKAPADNIIVTIKPDAVTDCAAIPRGDLTADELKATTDGAFVWAVVKIDGVVGFVRSDAGTVAVYVPPIELPPVPVPPDDEPMDSERVKLTKQEGRHILEDLRGMVTRIEVVLSAWETIETN